MESMAPKEFKELLDQHYQWPAEFMFKFIVKSDLRESIEKLEEVFGNLDLIEKSTKLSNGGKYTSFTVRSQHSSSDEVLEVYGAVSEIQGVVAL